MTQKEIKICYSEYDSLSGLGEEDRILAEKAIEATANSYAPYSGFCVGAAVRLSDGKIITGSNQENIAYPSGLCAERTAMFYASSTHPGEEMEAIAIAAVKDGKLCSLPASPCGACRQVMAEYQTRAGKEMRIILAGAEKTLVFDRVDDLLPFIFDSLK